MTPDAAAWVRAHAWTPAMRRDRGATDMPDDCACQYGPSGHCAQGPHRQCGRGTPLTFWEALICDRTGIYPVYLDDDRPATVWLADRVCRWVCPCPCHTSTPPTSGTVPRTRPATRPVTRPHAEQLDLLTLI